MSRDHGAPGAEVAPEPTPSGEGSPDGVETWEPAVAGHTARWVSLGVGLVLAVLVVFLFTREGGERALQSPLIGQLVPPVAGVTMDGDDFDIDELRGQWVVVNFFAHWCAPCRVEHPEFVAFAERHGATGEASIVSVAFDDEPEDARAFFDELGGDWPVLADRTAGIGIDFGVTGVPETYLVAPDGTVVAKWISTVDAATLEATIERYRTAPSSPSSPVPPRDDPLPEAVP
jgi:cytochrome c biogenesis protein CcmG, thiol:disulfide interchange protein DsbE